jgi:hypothetical protein
METYPWTHQRRHESFEFLQKIVWWWKIVLHQNCMR